MNKVQFNARYMIQRLIANGSRFKNIAQTYSHEEAVWRPHPDKWNLLEIFCHLRDEEKDDFRFRVRHCLTNPRKKMPSIDPTAWVEERNYAEQDFSDAASDFLYERLMSLDWLRALQNPDWTSTYQHPELGPMSAGMFLSNWLAHDYLHLRQILRWEYARMQSFTGHSLEYAGDWHGAPAEV